MKEINNSILLQKVDLLKDYVELIENRLDLIFQITNEIDMAEMFQYSVDLNKLDVERLKYEADIKKFEVKRDEILKDIFDSM